MSPEEELNAAEAFVGEDLHTYVTGKSKGWFGNAVDRAKTGDAKATRVRGGRVKGAKGGGSCAENSPRPVLLPEGTRAEIPEKAPREGGASTKEFYMNKEVWSLHSSYKDGDKEGCGVFDSPRAMAVGLARCVYDDHREDSRDDLVNVIALAVFDMFYGIVPEDRYISDECRDGYTVYDWEVDEVQSIGKETKDA